MLCQAWLHRRCSGVKSNFYKAEDGFRCRRCISSGGGLAQVQAVMKLKLGRNGELEYVDKYCYLGDMLGAGGGVEEATKARVRCLWAKFRKLALILTVRGAPLAVKGRVYKACVQRVLLYGSETWATRVEDIQRLERAERMMVRGMCGVTLKNMMPS